MGKTATPAVGGRARSIYNTAVVSYLKKYGDLRANGIVISQGYLRLESAALGTQGTINFACLVNEMAAGATAQSATEKRLALTDNFLITDAGFYIAKIASGSTIGATTLNTFPNALVYSGSNEATALQNIYNGSLNVRINGNTILNNWDIQRHYRVGNAQKSVLTAASGTGNAWDASTWDQPNYGAYPVTPGIELCGNAKNDINITLPASAAMAGTSSTNVAVWVFRGLLIQNGSKIAQ